ncbi:MAG: PIN domain-containing protein [Candidatus Hadarchaeota archaeon]|nr:PIN domain-containing protein [Candidatus Hadarchaeota archaeon]
MIFVDSTIWDAAQNERDKNHALARSILRDIGRGGHGKPVVTDYIIDEVLTWVNEKVGHSTAVKMSRHFFGDSGIEVVKVDWAVIHRARDLFEGKDFLSFTDATTAVVMEARNVKKIATFDSDFRKIGFEVSE